MESRPGISAPQLKGSKVFHAKKPLGNCTRLVWSGIHYQVPTMCIFFGGQLCVPHSTCWYTRCQLCASTNIVGGQLCAPTLVWFPNPLAPEIHVRWATQCFTSLRHLLLLFHNQVMCNYEPCSLNNYVGHISRICSTHAGILRSNTTL